MYHILIVEDDLTISELLQMNLLASGYDCDVVFDGKQALDTIRKDHYDLALLDIMLPGIDGFELLLWFRQADIPVIFVSAKNQVSDRVRGLRLGAEDYLVKPFDILELLVRMEKVLERRQTNPSVLSLDGVTVKEAEHRVEVNGKEIELKPMEYDLLLMFMKHPNVVMSREQLLREVWGDSFFGETRTVDNHVASLRKKLNWFDKIRKVHRVGYKLEVNR